MVYFLFQSWEIWVIVFSNKLSIPFLPSLFSIFRYLTMFILANFVVFYKCFRTFDFSLLFPFLFFWSIILSVFELIVCFRLVIKGCCWLYLVHFKLYYWIIFKKNFGGSLVKQPGPVSLIFLSLVHLTLSLCNFYGFTWLSICVLL